MASRARMSSSLSRPRACEIPSTAIGVFISPGRIAFTRMPYFALPQARPCVSAFTPAFDVLYAMSGVEQTEAIDETLTIDPLSLLLHDWQHVLASEKYTLQIHIEDTVPALLGQAREAGIAGARTDIVLEDVDPPERGEHAPTKPRQSASRVASAS